MKLSAQQSTIFASLSWNAPAWEVMWSGAAAIGDPRVCLNVASEGAAGVAKRVLLCLPEFSDAIPSDILVSLSLDLSRPIRGVAKGSRGRHRVEGDGVDADKITSSSWSWSKLGLIQFLKLAIDTYTESWLGISPSRVASSAVCVFLHWCLLGWSEYERM